MDGDTRTRVDLIEKYTAAARTKESACDCTHDAHRWSQLSRPLSLLGVLVLVCAVKEKDSPEQSDRVLEVPVISLNYHRTTNGLLTYHGQILVDEKYAEDSGKQSSGLAQLAGQLLLIVRNVRSYTESDSIAVIPGTEHKYSDQLGARLSRVARLNSVGLSQVTDTRRYVVDWKDCDGRRIILVDDVYRTGRTFRDAASCLFEAGAKEVVGLTATCTISRTDLPCSHGALDDAGRIRGIARQEERLSMAISYIQKALGEEALSPDTAARAIEEMHCDHARWLSTADGSNSR
jgi:hypothetical protein